MILPKVLNRFCKTCLKHTSQKCSEQKKKKPSELKKGQRRFRRKLKGYRGFPRPKPSSKRTIKKHSLLYVCSLCKKKNLSATNRFSKIEFK